MLQLLGGTLPPSLEYHLYLCRFVSMFLFFIWLISDRQFGCLTALARNSNRPTMHMHKTHTMLSKILHFQSSPSLSTCVLCSLLKPWRGKARYQIITVKIIIYKEQEGTRCEEIKACMNKNGNLSLSSKAALLIPQTKSQADNVNCNLDTI